MLIRFRPTTATAMAAVFGLALMANAAPAAAKEKPKKEEEAKKGNVIPASKGFIPSVKKMGDTLKAQDVAGLQAAIAEGESTASEPGDKYWLAFYKLQLGVLNKDKAAQSVALDALIDSGLTPPENAATYNFFSGNFAYGDKDYAKAVKRLEAAKAAGSTEAVLPVLLMDSYLNNNQLDQGLALAKTTIEQSRAAGRVPSEELYVRPGRALQAANRTNDLLDLLTLRVRDYPQPTVWRNTLYILLQQEGGDKASNLDTLRLMRATKSMEQRSEYMEYAALAVEAGYPGEAVSLIQEGQASGKISKSDQGFNQILESQGDRARADAPVLRADAAKPATKANPKAARATADALVGNGDYATAIPLYEAALAGAADPLTQYRLGVAQALAGQKEAALASFAKVQGNRQRLAQLWTIHLNAAPAAPAAPATGS